MTFDFQGFTQTTIHDYLSNASGKLTWDHNINTDIRYFSLGFRGPEKGRSSALLTTSTLKIL